MTRDEAVRAVLELAGFAAARGWARATSGNFSARIDAASFAVTRSGADKSRLSAADVGVVDLAGAPLEAGFRPSAETLLHAALYRRSAAIGAVTHTHSVASAVLSRGPGDLRLTGWEMQKAIAGVATHEAEIAIPVVDNDQDMVRLSAAIEPRIGPAPCYLVRGHGLTTWGADASEALRHLDAIEYLFECSVTRAC